MMQSILNEVELVSMLCSLREVNPTYYDISPRNLPEYCTQGYMSNFATQFSSVIWPGIWLQLTCFYLTDAGDPSQTSTHDCEAKFQIMRPCCPKSPSMSVKRFQKFCFQQPPSQGIQNQKFCFQEPPPHGLQNQTCLISETPPSFQIPSLNSCQALVLWYISHVVADELLQVLTVLFSKNASVSVSASKI